MLAATPAPSPHPQHQGKELLGQGESIGPDLAWVMSSQQAQRSSMECARLQAADCVIRLMCAWA